MSAVFQINQLEIVLLPKKHILGWHILVPYDIVYSFLNRHTDYEEICNFSRKGTHRVKFIEHRFRKPIALKYFSHFFILVETRLEF